MQYKLLNQDVRKSLLENTLLNIEQEHYSNTLAQKRAEAAGEGDQVAGFQNVLDGLEKQHKAISAELKKETGGEEE